MATHIPRITKGFWLPGIRSGSEIGENFPASDFSRSQIKAILASRRRQARTSDCRFCPNLVQQNQQLYGVFLYFNPLVLAKTES